MKKMTISELWPYLPDWVNYICYDEFSDQTVNIYQYSPEKSLESWVESIGNSQGFISFEFEIDWQCEWQDSLHKRPEFKAPTTHVYTDTLLRDGEILAEKQKEATIPESHTQELSKEAELPLLTIEDVIQAECNEKTMDIAFEKIEALEKQLNKPIGCKCEWGSSDAVFPIRKCLKQECECSHHDDFKKEINTLKLEFNYLTKSTNESNKELSELIQAFIMHRETLLEVNSDIWNQIHKSNEKLEAMQRKVEELSTMSIMGMRAEIQMEGISDNFYKELEAMQEQIEMLHNDKIDHAVKLRYELNEMQNDIGGIDEKLTNLECGSAHKTKVDLSIINLGRDLGKWVFKLGDMQKQIDELKPVKKPETSDKPCECALQACDVDGNFMKWVSMDKCKICNPLNKCTCDCHHNWLLSMPPKPASDNCDCCPKSGRYKDQSEQSPDMGKPCLENKILSTVDIFFTAGAKIDESKEAFARELKKILDDNLSEPKQSLDMVCPVCDNGCEPSDKNQKNCSICSKTYENQDKIEIIDEIVFCPSCYKYNDRDNLFVLKGFEKIILKYCHRHEIPPEINGAINPAWLAKFLKEPFKNLCMNGDNSFTVFEHTSGWKCATAHNWLPEKGDYFEIGHLLKIDTSTPWEESLFCKEDK
jgi:hypothetical protein